MNAFLLKFFISIILIFFISIQQRTFINTYIKIKNTKHKKNINPLDDTKSNKQILIIKVKNHSVNCIQYQNINK